MCYFLRADFTSCNKVCFGDQKEKLYEIQVLGCLKVVKMDVFGEFTFQ